MDEVSLMKSLVAQTQEELHTTMKEFLEEYYETVISTENYIMAFGDIPIALVAHMDTVFSKPPTAIFYDEVKQVMWSPEGLGADDRAGIFIISKIVADTKLRPTIILTCFEESGGIGANNLTYDYIVPPMDLKFMIELDRRGIDDCVFYECKNKSFQQYIEKFGFTTRRGIFTDISIIAPAWNISAVNLSVGYIEEHSRTEHFFFKVANATMKKVIKILKDADAPSFTYHEDDELTKCEECGEVYPFAMGYWS